MPRPFRFAIVFACIALVLAANAEARNKKPGSQGGTCSCECRSDEKTSSLLPRYTSQISFAESVEHTCRRYGGFGGCRIEKPGGGYASGTMFSCTFKKDGAASLGTSGVDPSGGNAPTQPSSKPTGGVERNP